MNKEILNNLYEFWTYIGAKTNKLVENEGYKSISIIDSDWPNRVFSISTKKDILSEIVDLSQKKLLPNIITIPKPNSLENNSQVKTSKDAWNFAKTASEAFGYNVGADITYLLSENHSKIRLFNYLIINDYLGCGIVFFDSYNNAGLHMIGTIPKGRGKGIGNEITKKLILEAKTNKSKNSVLHASLMGERIFRKLGFISFDKIETYQVLGKTDNN